MIVASTNLEAQAFSLPFSLTLLQLRNRGSYCVHTTPYHSAAHIVAIRTAIMDTSLVDSEPRPGE